MSSDKPFPNPEPPPHPEGVSNSPPLVDPKLASIMEPASQQNPGYIDPSNSTPSQSPALQQIPAPQQAVNYIPKKGMPKGLLFALIFLGGAILIFIIVFFVKGSGVGGGSLVGTKGEVTWWGIENKENIVAPLIEEYQNNNPNVRINYVEQSPQDYRERLTNALASGKGPDIFEIHNSWVPMFKNDLSSLPEAIMSKDEYVKSFYPVVANDFNLTTGIVAMPLSYDALTLYINDSIFTSSLKSAPRTWDELNQVAKDLTQRPKDLIIQAGVGLGVTENVEYWPEIIGLMVAQNGVNFAKPEGSQVKFALQYFSHFTTTDKVWDSTQPESGTAFSKGKLAMYFAPVAKAQEIIKENPSLRFRTIPLPQLPKEKATDPDYSYATYWAEGVWKRSRNSEVAWNFIKFLSSPESLQKMNRLRKDSGLIEKVYPRPEMATLQKEDTILGSVVELAPFAKSWYLADKTKDGATGINSQVNQIFNDAIDSVATNRDTDKTIKELSTKINTVVAKYSSTRK